MAETASLNKITKFLVISGVWDMRGKHMFHGIEIKVWAIACFIPQRECPEEQLRRFTQLLIKSSEECGMPITSQPCFCKYARRPEDVRRPIVHTLYNYVQSYG